MDRLEGTGPLEAAPSNVPPPCQSKFRGKTGHEFRAIRQNFGKVWARSKRRSRSGRRQRGIAPAGGGLKNGITIGETDELGMSIVSRPVSIPDLHATIHCALGINPAEELYAGDRPVPITDGGQPIRELSGI